MRRAAKRVVVDLTDATEILFRIGPQEAVQLVKKAGDTPVPDRPQPPIPPRKASPKITACMKAVWLTVCRAKARLTQPKIARAMQDAGMHPYSERWIADACQRLVEEGLLKRHPDGYEPVVDDGDEVVA